MADDRRRHRHFILDDTATTEQFSRGGRGSTPRVPPRDRPSHATTLRRQLEALRAVADEAKAVQKDAGVVDGIGIQVEFRSFPEVELVAERLSRERSGIELLSVREDAKTKRTHATVFVPDGRLGHFERIVQDYAEERKDRAGRSRDYRTLVDAIQELRSATLRALWTDSAEEFPTDEQAALWWEVWLPAREDHSAAVANFRKRIDLLGSSSAKPRVGEGELFFPERAVLLVYATVQQLHSSMYVLNNIAELRRAKDTAEFFEALPAEEQPEWVTELLARMTFKPSGANVPYVCMLDTGVNRGHPLLAPLVDPGDLHTVDPNLGVGDNNGHGTEMAGLATLGDLTPLLGGTEAVSLEHRLESVKLFDDPGSTGTVARHHGYLTQEAVARAELAEPHRKRIFGMAVTAPDNRDRGQPSAWSAAIDSLAADADGAGDSRRLVVVSGGNATHSSLADYPESNDTDGVHDPAQSWNALVIGAYTERIHITEDDAGSYSPVASEGGLSPFSTTSLTWQSQWPMKPDIVLEGGNAGTNNLGPVAMQSLSLLTTYYRPTERLLTTTNATSAATALASRMAAQVAAEYPELWPETIRALMVHAAQWTEAMKSTYLTSSRVTKENYEQLIRRCGFGVPKLDRALHSAADSLTMVVQQALIPFKRDEGKEPSLRDMHLHQLPWPTEALEGLGELPVEMRVTLSYFIEPNPSRRGHSGRYAYQSHGLRFDVRRPTETVDAFRQRINAAASAEDGGRPSGTSDAHWLIGTQRRHKGSLHSDIWRGTAAELASRDSIAVYPTSGWWKTRHVLKRYALPAPYALVVSIEAPEADVDLYAEVASRVEALVQVA